MPKGPVRIGMYCSANLEIEPEFFHAGTHFAQGLVSRKWEMIYGGSNVGLMGHIANGVLSAGGVARGAITESLAQMHEMPHKGLQELVVVKDLMERKRWMMEKSAGFAIFPGGFGTLDEALEVITWKSLGYFNKPIVFVNINGFWQSQINVFNEMSNRGMIRAGGLSLFETCDSVDQMWAVFDGAFSGGSFSDGSLLK